MRIKPEADKVASFRPGVRRGGYGKDKVAARGGGAWDWIRGWGERVGAI